MAFRAGWECGPSAPAGCPLAKPCPWEPAGSEFAGHVRIPRLSLSHQLVWGGAALRLRLPLPLPHCGCGLPGGGGRGLS